MDSLFVIAVAQLTFFSLLALCFNAKTKVLGMLVIGIVISWYLGVYRATTFNELAVQEFNAGVRDHYPADGASAVFSLYFGWIPGLLYASLLFGAGRFWQLLRVTRNK